MTSRRAADFLLRRWWRLGRHATACAALGSAIALAGCQAGAGSRDAPASSTESNPRPVGGAVRLDASQIQQVQTEELSTHAPEEAIKATGTVDFNADRMARVLPPVSGQVRDLGVKVGDSVLKDSVLFVLSSREVAGAISDHRASHKDLELAEKTFAMTDDLFAHQAASRMALQQAENDVAKARAKVLQSEEVLQVLGLDGHREDDAAHMPSRLPVRSPITGTVMERTVTSGQFVGPDNPPLLTIADLTNVWVQADVFERDVRHISVGQKADVTTAAYPNQHFIAEVSHVGDVVDPQTRTAKVRILVANPHLRLKPGMFASVSLSMPDAGSFLTVPAKAVLVENGKSFAYVQVGALEFHRREIDTLASGTDRLRIVRGLMPGDRVITDGVLLLRQLESDSSNQ